MDDLQIKLELIEQLIEISKEAGKAILEVYNTNFDYQIKEDLSPLTQADTVSHNIICDRLKILTPDIPIISEENSDIPFNIRSLWKKYWLIDPLDGTKEFIKRNGEFTVNIALIENNMPILGVIYIPISNQTYWGSNNLGSFYIQGNRKAIQINVSQNSENPLTIATSASHPSKDLGNLLEKIKNYKIIKKGSSIKLCLVACGEADVYLRLGPTSEWDTAAGEAIAMYAGGSMKKVDGSLMAYNKKKKLRNEYFIVAKNEELVDLFLSLIN